MWVRVCVRLLRGLLGEDKPSPLLWTTWRPVRSIVGAMACPRPARAPVLACVAGLATWKASLPSLALAWLAGHPAARCMVVSLLPVARPWPARRAARLGSAVPVAHTTGLPAGAGQE